MMNEAAQPRPAPPDDEQSLDLLLLRIFRRLLWLSWPTLACVQLTVGAHLARQVIAAGATPRWLSAAAAAAAVGWTTVALTVARRLWPSPAGPADLLEVLGFSRQWAVRGRNLCVIAALVGLAILAIPAFGPLFALAVSVTLGLWVNEGPSPHKEKRVMTKLAGLLLMAGVALIGASYLPVPDRVVTWGVLAITLLLAAAPLLTLLLIVVVLIVGRESTSLSVRVPWVLVAETAALELIGFIPLVWFFVGGRAAAGSFVVFCLLVLPATLLLIAVLLIRDAWGDCVDRALKVDLRKTLSLNAEQTAYAEDAVRESDGYHRVISPVFRNIRPHLCGDRGYVAWLGDKVREPLEGLNGQVLLFRSPRKEDGIVFETCDRIGIRLARFFGGAVPDLDSERLRNLLRDFLAEWSVRRIDAAGSVMVGKLPWEQPEMFAYPLAWTTSHTVHWTYPAGSGLYDRDGMPCRARNIEASITLIPPTNFDDPADEVAATRRRAWLRLLLWHGPRIVPGCYESLLTCLRTALSQFSVATLFGSGERSNNREALLSQLNAAWQAALPEPIGQLVRVSISNISADTFVAGKVRERQQDLRTFIGSAGNKIDEEYRSTINYVKKAFSERGGRGDLTDLQIASIKSRIDEAKKIFEAEISHALASTPDTTSRNSGDALAMHQDKSSQWTSAVDKSTANMQAAMNKLIAAIPEAYSQGQK